MSLAMLRPFATLLWIVCMTGCRSDPPASEPSPAREASTLSIADQAPAVEADAEPTPASLPAEPTPEAKKTPQALSELGLDDFPELPPAARQLGLELELELAALDQRFGPHAVKDNPNRPAAKWLEWRGVSFDNCPKTDLTFSQEAGKLVFMAVELGSCRATMEKLVNALGYPGLFRQSSMTWIFREHLVNLKLDEASLRVERISDELRAKLTADPALSERWLQMQEQPRPFAELLAAAEFDFDATAYDPRFVKMIQAGAVDDVRRVLEIRPGLVMGRNPKHGATALHDAAVSAQAEIGRLLIARGAKLEARDEAGWRPLHFAAGVGDVAMVSLLLEAGAELNAAVDEGDTALHIAAFKKRAAVVAKLLEVGASVELLDKDGNTALRLARMAGDEATLAAFVDAGVGR